MQRTTALLILALVVGGCAGKTGNFAFSRRYVAKIPNRYEDMDRQTAYVTMRFTMDTNRIIGKTRAEVRDIMGEPIRIEKYGTPNLQTESWMYYPKDTNNFIAIIIRFEGDKAKTCQYETVM